MAEQTKTELSRLCPSALAQPALAKFARDEALSTLAPKGNVAQNVRHNLEDKRRKLTQKVIEFLQNEKINEKKYENFNIS